MAKILIAESFDTSILENFQSSLEFVYKPDLSLTELENEIAEYDGLMVRPKQVTAQAIENAENLKLIIRGGAGVNSIDLFAAKARGIIVANTPGLNSDATAEFTMLLMFEAFCKRQLHKSNSWQSDPGTPDSYKGFELRGKKLGVIGLGNIGQRVAKIAQAFGMEVLCYARNKKDLPFKQTSDLNELLAAGNDILSLHIPLNDETDGIINKSAFAQMNKNTTIINTARPSLIDVPAFAEALDNGILTSYGIDGDYDQIEPFIKVDPKQRGLATHHIADCTFESQAAITQQALAQMKAFFEEGIEINRVA